MSRLQSTSGLIFLILCMTRVPLNEEPNLLQRHESLIKFYKGQFSLKRVCSVSFAGSIRRHIGA